MQKYLKLLIIIAFMAMIGCHSDPKESEKPHKLVIGITADFPPFEYQKNGKFVGYDVDLIQAVCKEMGMETEIKDMSFHALLASLKSGKIDVAISSIAVTPERQQQFDFSHVYHRDQFALIYVKGNPPPDVKNLSHKRIGVQLGTSMEMWAKNKAQEHQDLHLLTLDLSPILIEQLKLGKVDYVLINLPQAVAFCKGNTSLTFDLVGSSEEGMAIMLEKGSPLIDPINDALTTLKEKGFLKALENKWLISGDPTHG